MRKVLASRVIIALSLLGVTAAAAGLHYCADHSQLTDEGEYHAPPVRCYFRMNAPDANREPKAE